MINELTVEYIKKLLLRNRKFENGKALLESIVFYIKKGWHSKLINIFRNSMMEICIKIKPKPFSVKIINRTPYFLAMLGDISHFAHNVLSKCTQNQFRPVFNAYCFAILIILLRTNNRTINLNYHLPKRKRTIRFHMLRIRRELYHSKIRIYITVSPLFEALYQTVKMSYSVLSLKDICINYIISNISNYTPKLHILPLDLKNLFPSKKN